MFSGIAGAISQAYKSADPWTATALATINSGAVAASGLQNIAKIKATQITTNAVSSAASATKGLTQSLPATVEAPSLTPVVNNVRNITSQSEEELLNKIAEDKQVYILQSELEASHSAVKARINETTF